MVYDKVHCNTRFGIHLNLIDIELVATRQRDETLKNSAKEKNFINDWNIKRQIFIGQTQAPAWWVLQGKAMFFCRQFILATEVNDMKNHYYLYKSRIFTLPKPSSRIKVRAFNTKILISWSLISTCHKEISNELFTIFCDAESIFLTFEVPNSLV